MLRRSLSLSLIFPLGLMLLMLMVAVSFDYRVKQKMPEIRPVSVGLIGLITAWIPISFYLRIRRRVLTPLRDLKQKLQRACKDQPDSLRAPRVLDEIGELVVSYNQLASDLWAEREERQRYERERMLQSNLIALGLQADGLVHELASPLSALSTLASLAANGDAESAKRLGAESRLLTDRLKRFMAVFRERKVAVRRFSVADLISGRIQRFHQGRVSFEFAAPSEPLDLLSDEVLFTEILDNLLQNAERHAKTKVEVEAVRDGEETWVTVTDDGAGIPPQYTEKLFRPFFTTSEGGHGLGLFVSRLWIQALGGSLDLAAARHAALGGASFRMRMPARGQF